MVSGKSPEELPPGWKEHVKVRNGRKLKYYINVVTGLKFYSKKRVIHFATTKDVCQGTSQPLGEHDQKSSRSKSEATPSQIAVESKESLEWLPRGWIVESRTRKSGLNEGSIYKIYIEPSTGRKFYSKPQVIKYLESVDCNDAPEKQKKEVSRDISPEQCAPQCCESMQGKSYISEKNENDIDQPSLEIVSCDLNKRNVVDELPPGWIKESRARKSQSTRKDPYYIDPINGYEFRSKKDALRYLETGDIASCAMKPKKRDASDVKLVDDNISAQPDGKKLGQSPAGRQLFVGQKSEEDGVGSLGSIKAAPEAERSKATEGDRVAADSNVSTSTVDAVEDMQLCSQVIKHDTSCENSQPSIELSKLDVMVTDVNGTVFNTATADLHQQKQVEAKRSKETQCNNMSADVKVATTVDVSDNLQLCSELIKCGTSADSFQPETEGSKLDVKADDNGAVSDTATDVLHEQKDTQNLFKTRTQIQLKKSKKRKMPSLPARSSKRLSGQEPDMLPNFGVSERALRAACRKPGQTEANMSSSLAQNSTANGLPQQLDTNPQREVTADVVLPCKVTSLETEMQNNIEKPSEDQAVQEQAAGQVNEKREEENPRSQDSQFWYPFGDSLSDPCYEFAFKTLTGEIPFEDTLAFQGCFQPQVETSLTQGGVSFGLSEIDTPAIFQNDLPFHFDSVQQSVSTDQLPTSTVPPGNTNVPRGNGYGPQRPNLEARSKDNETKANS